MYTLFTLKFIYIFVLSLLYNYIVNIYIYIYIYMLIMYLPNYLSANSIYSHNYIPAKLYEQTYIF